MAAPVVTEANHSLIFGGLLMTDDPNSAAAQQRGWWITPLAEGWTLGNAEPLMREIQAFLADGAFVDADREGNRTLELPFKINGLSNDHLAQANALLDSKTNRRTELQWTPPEVASAGAGEPGVFSVAYSKLDQIPYSDGERKCERRFQLTLYALPHVRSTRLRQVTLPAPSNQVTTQSIDPCDSASGWSTAGTAGGSVTPPTVVNSSVQVTGSRPSSLAYFEFTLRRSFAQPIALNGRGFMRVEYAPDVRVPGAVYIDESKVEASAAMGRVFWYPCPNPTFTSIAFADGTPWRPTATTQYPLGVADLTASSQPFDSTTATRQGTRRFDVLGSVRTPASLRLSTTDTALGSTLLYVAPVGRPRVAPPLRAWKSTSEQTTADPAAISGVSHPLDTFASGTVYAVPAELVPEGGYQLAARLRRPAGAAQFTLTVSTAVGAPNIPGNVYTDRTITSASGGSTWMPILPLGHYTLPARTVGRSGSVLIKLYGAGLLIDELWLFSLDGSLVHIEPIATDLLKHTWVDSPSFDNQAQKVLTGLTSDKTDAVDPAATLMANDPIMLEPGPVDVFFATAGSSVTSTSMAYYDRYRHYVPKIA